MPMRWRLAISLCCLTVLAACGELQDWQSTEKADTLEAYESFLERYPESQYAPVAERRIAILVEERDWRLASERDTAEAYRQFVDAYPKGRWASEGRLRLQNFMSAPGVLGPAAVEPIERPVEPIPTPELKPTTTAPPPSTETSAQSKGVRHRIQLGAFSTRDKAEQGWRTARDRYPDLRGLVPQIIGTNSDEGSIYRLRAGVVSEARAREICGKLSAAGQACVYVPPGR
jgi:hypothetical protein